MYIYIYTYVYIHVCMIGTAIIYRCRRSSTKSSRRTGLSMSWKPGERNRGGSDECCYYQYD